MPLRLTPLAELLPRAAAIGIIDEWHVHDTGIEISRGSRTFQVGPDELIDVLFELTEEHRLQTVTEGSMHLLRSAA